MTTSSRPARAVAALAATCAAALVAAGCSGTAAAPPDRAPAGSAPALVTAAPPAGTAGTPRAADTPGAAADARGSGTAAPGDAPAASGDASAEGGGGIGTAPSIVTAAPGATARPAHTWCRSVAHIGDSTSVGLWDASNVGGDPDATLDARYRAVGVESVFEDSSGGRAMEERIDAEQRNAIEVARAVRDAGFDGCWVLMIGTNDAANVEAGANLGLTERIDRLMAVIGTDPVLWVDTSSRSDIPFYGSTAMDAFNAALEQATLAHPNIHVFDWAAVVQPEWYSSDGLHYGTEGRVRRAELTALALADAFPD